MPDLFGGEEEEHSDNELKINKGYATNYNNWRQKEELNKLKTKYGEHLNELNSDDNVDDDDESSSSSEDEEAVCLTEESEKRFYETLSHLQKKDPKIYDNNVDFFAQVREQQGNSVDDNPKKKEKKSQPMYLRDYERKIITERDGKYSDSEDEETGEIRKNEQPVTIPYVEEQRQIIESIKKDTAEIDDDDEIFKCKSKPIDENVENDEKMSGGKSKNSSEPKKKMFKPSMELLSNPQLSSEEKFLHDYVLNNKFLEANEGQYNFSNVDDEIYSEDEKNLEENQEFEHKYNYRYEEPDQEFIKRYPRTMENSLRKKDTKRSEKRAQLKQRKEEEKIRKKEELKQLKALKRKEIMDKIEQLKEITGNDDMQLDPIDLDGDFDPDEHDRKMQELFDEDYYQVNEDVKPEFPEIDEELGIETTWDTYDPNNEIIADDNDADVEPHCEDADFNMDADYDANKSLKEELIGTSKKKRRRRSKFAEVIAKQKPKFDPNVHSSLKKYIEQYYELDYEDMIDDIPCRFKYRNVVPNDYGLTVEEIMTADDKELNRWCSLKKALEHKSEQVEINEVRVFKQKASNEMYKKKILPSLYKPLEEEEKEETKKEEDSITVPAQTNEESTLAEDSAKKKRKRKKKTSNANVNQEKAVEMSESSKTLEDNEIPVINKKKKNLKRSAETESAQDNGNNTAETSQIEMKRQKIKKATECERREDQETNRQVDKPLSKKLQRKAEFLQRRKKNAKAENSDTTMMLSDERLKAYKINPRKFKNKLKYGKKN